MVVIGFDNREKNFNRKFGIVTYKIQQWKMKVIL